MRWLIALPAGGMLLLAGALATPPQPSTAGWMRLNNSYYAQAQTPANEPVIVKRSINLTEEDRHTIREIVLKDSKVSPEKSSDKVEIGDKSPESITTYEFPDLATSKIGALKSQKYFIKDGAIVIVSSNDGKVADIIKPE